MEPEISVRPANAADIEAIILLSRVLALHVEDPDPGDDPGAILEAYFLAEPWGECLVAEIGSGIVGFIGLCRYFDAGTRLRSLCITDLAVLPDARRRGVGRALLEAARQRALRLGAEAILFEVWKGNHSALRFYKRMGADILNDRHLMCLPISDYATRLISAAAGPSG